MEKNKKLTGRPNILKQVNIGLIKDSLHKLGTATRVEIAEMTRLSQPTVNAIIKQMIKEDLVIEKGLAVSSGGRQAMKYALNTEAVCVAAIIAEQESLEYEVRDISGRVLERGKSPVNPAKSYVENMLAFIEKLLDINQKIKAVTVGVPGAVTGRGKIFAIPRIGELEDCDLREILKGKFNIAVNVRNDIKTIALGYFRTSAEPKSEDMVYLHFGSGLGAGIIVGKQIVNGFSSFAGEIGYMQVGEKQATERILLSTDDAKVIESIISKIVINMICFINPPVIVLGGTRMGQELADNIRTNCLKQLPAGMIPLFAQLKDEKKFYFEGLIQTAIDSITGEVRLILD